MDKTTLVERIENTSKVDLLFKVIFIIGIIILASIIIGIKKDTAFGAIVTVIGIIFAMYLVLEQMLQQSRELKLQALRNHVISASENVHLYQIYEGLVVSEIPNDRFIASWYVEFMGNQKHAHYHFNFFFKILPKHKNLKKIMKKNLKWDYRVTVPRFGCNHGVVVEITPAKNYNIGTIAHMDDYSRKCVLSALKQIQFGDLKRLSRYRRWLHKSPFKMKNRKISMNSIFFAAKSISRKY